MVGPVACQLVQQAYIGHVRDCRERLFTVGDVGAVIFRGLRVVRALLRSAALTAGAVIRRRMHPKAIAASFVLVSAISISTAANAQEVSGGVSTSTSTATPPTPDGGGGGELGNVFGVGAQALLTGPVGPAVVYNAGRFHFEGMFTFTDIGDSSGFVIAGRAWLHIHNSPNATLSVGGGGGLQNVDTGPAMPGGMDNKASNFLLEGGAQIRFMATRNVAISASAGLGIVTGDGDALAVTGQITGAMGITYFIF